MAEEREEQRERPKEKKYKVEKSSREEQATTSKWIDAAREKIRPPNTYVLPKHETVLMGLKLSI